MLPYSRRAIPHKLARAAKEVDRTHPNPVPEGTSSAASESRPILDLNDYAAAFSR